MELSTITQQTMSSKEIAELTGKRHDNVLADIRKLLNDVENLAPEISGAKYEDRGKQYDCFNLSKDASLTLVTGYSSSMRYAVIKRWQELEAVQPKLPTTYLEALEALVAETKVKEALQLQLDESKEWLSIKRMAKLNGISWKDISWRELKRVSLEMGKAPKKIFDANYGEVNTYHINAWDAAYPDLEQPFNG